MAEGVRVIYSIGAKFAGGGIGTVAYHAVRGLHRHRMLQRLLCGSFRPTEIPSSHRISHIHNILYDAWASRHLEPADLFHVWGNCGLASLRRARAMEMMTVVEWASSHPLWRAQLLREEYARWGLTFRLPQASLLRSLAEMEAADYVLIPSSFVYQRFLEQGFPER